MTRHARAKAPTGRRGAPPDDGRRVCSRGCCVAEPRRALHCPAMPQHIGSIALLVCDFDAAMSYVVEKLGFTVAEATDLGDCKR